MKVKTKQVNEKLIGKTLNLAGWVAKKRNLGGLIFIDLRDRYGLLQLIVRPESPVYELAETLRNEYVIEVSGILALRESENKNLETGRFELEVNTLKVLSVSKNPPLIIADKTDALEDVRLKYRYLDLRRPVQKSFILKRAEIVRSVRKSLEAMDFVEIDTPILAKSTPEGARDYLVPSRLYHGQFFALPQSPQIYKQLLMVAGFEKYYQIAKCFRDEDLRADRQPEFTQIDIEASFVDEKQIMQMVEKMFKKLFKDVLGYDLPRKFPVLKFKDAIAKYGSDKPDLRYDLEITDFTWLKESGSNFIDSFKSIRGIRFSANDKFTRKILDELAALALKNSLAKTAFLKVADGKISGSLAKELTESEVKKLALQPNEIIFLGLGEYEKVSKGLGAVRVQIANILDLIQPNDFKVLWVTDFPLFEVNPETKALESMHHAFTQPKNPEMLFKNPKKCLARHYDLVLNGYELGSGSIRVHDSKLQAEIFKTIGLSDEDIKQKFGFLIEAFQYGTPPHGGIGLGLDRIVMIMCNTTNIKDIVAFPKTQSARDLMNDSPNSVWDIQLAELGIKMEEEKQ